MSNPYINPKRTTADGLARARAAIHGNWDSRGVIVTYLPATIVEKALADRGWQRGEPSRRGPGPWISSTGHREWDIDYAFALAITAETLATGPGGLADDEQVLRGVIDAVLERDPHAGPWLEVLTERIVEGADPPVMAAVSSARLVIASRVGRPTDLWQHLRSHRDRASAPGRRPRPHLLTPPTRRKSPCPTSPTPPSVLPTASS